jgi:hypothetical protein
MATGALDPQGVWQYGEDDLLANPTWSAYMNKLAASVSALLVTQTYVPGFTNLTVGTGTRLGRFTRAGKRVLGDAQIVFAADTVVGGSLYTALPVAPLGAATASSVGTWTAQDVSAGAFRSGHLFRSGSSAQLRSPDGTAVTGSVPWTWGTGDTIWCAFNYEGT